MQKRLIGHMANNKYSITCVHQSIFSQLKNVRRSSENGQLAALENALVAQRFSSRDALVAMIRNIYSSNILLVSHFKEYH